MGIKKSPEETARRREEVKYFMETIGPFSVPVKTLAEKYGVTVKVIYNDIQYWIKKIDLKKIDLQGKKLIMSLTNNMAIIEELKSEGSSTERIRAIQAANQTAEVLTKIMENYGFKEKVADNLNIQSEQQIIFQEVIKSNKEIKEMKNDKGDNSKSETK